MGIQSIEYKPSGPIKGLYRACVCIDPDPTGQEKAYNPLTKTWMVYNPRKLWKCAGPQCQFYKAKRVTDIVPLPEGFTNKKFYGHWNY